MTGVRGVVSKAEPENALGPFRSLSQQLEACPVKVDSDTTGLFSFSLPYPFPLSENLAFVRKGPAELNAMGTTLTSGPLHPPGR